MHALHENVARYNAVQRARYGQNYIKDPSVIRRLLQKTLVRKEDTVLEIGPGHGIFTQELLKRAGHVVAIEIDDENIRFLRTTFQKQLQTHQLELIHKDALQFEPRWAKTSLPHHKYVIVASIPLKF